MIRETTIARSVRLICLSTLAISTHQAFAQATPPADQPLQQVMVTGSRIASPNAESPSPLQVLTAADIASSGVTNVQELLLKNPTMGTPTESRTNSNFQTSSAGVSTVDLRNLGTSRT
ncbi:MAG TPA: TonB-dependent receptor, partial [Pseudoduganella sp.]